jgi:hypothetical protein
MEKFVGLWEFGKKPRKKVKDLQNLDRILTKIIKNKRKS